MSKSLMQKKPETMMLGAAFLLALLGCAWGCGAKKPPLSPAAAAFKKEIKECINTLSHPLIKPVLKRDTASIQACLENSEPDALKLCRMCPFRMGVLDKNGDTLAVHPPNAREGGLDFYRYEVVQQVLKTRKIAIQRLFLQNGSRLYVICAPLLQGEKIVGILAIAMSADEAQKRWGLTEKEFLKLDINR